MRCDRDLSPEVRDTATSLRSVGSARNGRSNKLQRMRVSHTVITRTVQAENSVVVQSDPRSINKAHRLRPILDGSVASASFSHVFNALRATVARTAKNSRQLASSYFVLVVGQRGARNDKQCSKVTRSTRRMKRIREHGELHKTP